MRWMLLVCIVLLVPVVFRGDSTHNPVMAFGGIGAQIGLFVLYTALKIKADKKENND